MVCAILLSGEQDHATYIKSQFCKHLLPELFSYLNMAASNPHGVQYKAGRRWLRETCLFNDWGGGEP